VPTFALTQDDLDPSLVVAMRNADGKAYVPQAGSTATFKMVHRGTGLIITGAASIGGANGDQLTYDWQAGQTAKVGEYDAQFKVLAPGGHTISFPTAVGHCASGPGCLGPVVGGGSLALIVQIVPSL